MMKLTLIYCLLMMSFASCEAKGKPWSRQELRKHFADERVVELVIAANEGDVKSIDRLVQEGADVNYRGQQNLTPLFAALSSANLQGFKRLLEHGADPNIPTTDGDSVIWWLVAGDKPDVLIDMLKLALQHGGDPNWRYHNDPTKNVISENEGEPLITTAVSSEQAIEKIKILLGAGADINGKDNEGFNALSRCTTSKYDVAFFLLQAGADYAAKDNFGKDYIWNVETFPPTRLGDKKEVERQRMFRQKVIEFLEEKGLKLQLKYPR